MCHYIDAIRRSGAPFEYSSNLYEHLHIALMKSAYRNSNRRNYSTYIVKHNKRLQALRKYALEREGFSQPVEKTTALDLVHEIKYEFDHMPLCNCLDGIKLDAS